MISFRTILIAGLTAGGAVSPTWAQSPSGQLSASTGTIFQPIALAKTADLAFGTVVRPTSGAGTVTISAADGARTLAGGVGAIEAAPSGRATFTVVGEGGQAFSVTVPANMDMTRAGGAEIIPVALTSSMSSGVLSGAPGEQGVNAFGVGGSAPVSSATVSGAYTGTFNVTVAYN